MRRRTVNADVRFGPLADISCESGLCPLYPQKRTSIDRVVSFVPKADILTCKVSGLSHQ
jgi:hypothetical protein